MEDQIKYEYLLSVIKKVYTSTNDNIAKYVCGKALHDIFLVNKNLKTIEELKNDTSKNSVNSL